MALSIPLIIAAVALGNILPNPYALAYLLSLLIGLLPDVLFVLSPNTYNTSGLPLTSYLVQFPG
jgi:hypothetical protein|nr:MAG TPA: hypothetical protein [Bacteriophage sp.]